MLGCRGLRSLVDWNPRMTEAPGIVSCRGLRSLVDWNKWTKYYHTRRISRGLRSLVDWNTGTNVGWVKHMPSRLTQPRGLKFQRMKRSFLRNPSRLTQPRGLKSIRNIYSMRLIGRGLRSLVDWNMDIKWYIELIYNIILDGKTDENMDWNIEYMLRKEMTIAKYIRSIFHNL